MPIRPDAPDEPPLPPLFARRPPAIPVDTLAAIETVTLSAGEIPRGLLRAFYTQTLGLTYLDGDEQILRFSHHARRIHLDRRLTSPGQLTLLIRQFSDALLRLRAANIPHEVLHGDAGLTRSALLRDPAGNWITLLETRDF